MKAAKFMLMAIGVFFLAQEGQAITAEEFWTQRIPECTSTTTNITYDTLNDAFGDHNYFGLTDFSEFAADAAKRVAKEGGEEDICKFEAFSKLANTPGDQINVFLQKLN